jgi:diguanylate cyclase (GGDEF)-like protein/PAS domain S-box-containing protein
MSINMLSRFNDPGKKLREDGRYMKNIFTRLNRFIKNNGVLLMIIMAVTFIGIVVLALAWKFCFSLSSHPFIECCLAAGIIFCIILLIMAHYSVFTKNMELNREKEKLLSMDGKLKSSEMLFRTIFEQLPIGISIGQKENNEPKDNDKPSINPMYEKITGRTKEELETTGWTEITHPDDLPIDLENLKRFKAGEIDGYKMEKRYIRPDGSNIWVKMTISPLHIESLPDYEYLCVVEDISGRKEMEKALYDSERSMSVFINNLLGMAYRCNYDRDWTMQFVSDGCFDLTGYHSESLLHNRDLSFNDLIAPEYRETLWNEWARILALQIPFKSEYEIICADGEKKWVLEMGQGIYGEKGNVEALEGIIIDITENKKKEAQIEYMNYHDYLTGLYNRIYFEEMKIKMNREECLPISVMLWNINGVRLINDAFGYNEGNLVICEVSKILQRCCRPRDILARTGGDEFALLLPNTNTETAREMMEIVSGAVADYNEKNKSKLYEITLSVGHATKDTAAGDLEETSKLADEYLRNRKLLDGNSSHSDIISSVMATMYERSQETEEHAKRLAAFSKGVGEKLNLSQKSLGELQLLAMLHDIGKVGIDDRVLNKPGKLDEAEWAVMKKHPEIGYRIVKSTSELEPIAEYILTHHEHWDGKGYPRGLKGENIPLLSRIIAVVDAYDAMTVDRVYQKAMTKEQALKEIRRNSGTQFNPEVVKIFIEYLS